MKRGDTNIWLILFVKSFGKLLFSVSRLWKISLFDCQVLWVQYKSTSMIYKRKRTIIGINFWNENAKKNPIFLKKKLKILWRRNRSLIHYLTPKICRSTLLASRGKIYTFPHTCIQQAWGNYIHSLSNILPILAIASIGKIQTLVPFSLLLVATLEHCPLIPTAITFCKTIISQTVQQKRNR